MGGAHLIRVMFVDDHPVLRAGLAAILGAQDDIEVVAEAGSGEEALILYRRYKPDVTLMDLRLPGMSGVETIAAIRKEDPAARILVLTSYDLEEDIFQALRAGAQAYLLKDMLRKELLQAIRRVHAGQRYLPQTVAARLAERLPKEDLTPRETEVLTLIVKGLSNREIAGAIGATQGTVRIHVSHILGKLHVSDRTQAAVQAIQRGLVHLK